MLSKASFGIPLETYNSGESGAMQCFVREDELRITFDAGTLHNPLLLSGTTGKVRVTKKRASELDD